ncbi:MAG: glucosamine-6-phosphate deaminase [bacterium]
MRVIIVKDYDAMSKKAGEFLAGEMKKKPNFVLGLATGSTPIGLYKELIRLNKTGEIDFSKTITFNLDEYIGLAPTHNQSYHYFMFDNLLNHININSKNVHVPDGLAKDVEKFCEEYEKMIDKSGGLDVQVLGIGGNGHIGFNEPGSSLGSKTRIKTLTQKTIDDNARFFDKKEDVPCSAITMGVGTIMNAKKCLILANGKNKAEAVFQTIEGCITAQVPASALQLHQYVIAIIDEAAASELKGENYERI